MRQLATSCSTWEGSVQQKWNLFSSQICENITESWSRYHPNSDCSSKRITIVHNSSMRRRPYKWIAPLSKNKNALITRRPTAKAHPLVIRRTQVLAFCYFSIVMSLYVLWLTWGCLWIMCYEGFILIAVPN